MELPMLNNIYICKQTNNNNEENTEWIKRITRTRASDTSDQRQQLLYASDCKKLSNASHPHRALLASVYMCVAHKILRTASLLQNY